MPNTSQELWKQIPAAPAPPPLTRYLAEKEGNLQALGAAW